MNRLSLLGAFLIGCGGAVSSGDAGSTADSGSKADVQNDAIVSYDAGAFCSGSTSRLMVNGAEVTVVSATGHVMVLNCCDSAELVVATSAYQALLNVLWRSPAGSSSSPVDLGNPPSGFALELDLGCDPAATSCATASPEERYADGFQGTLTYKYDSAGLMTGYCLSVSEAPSAPHAVIHSMTLYTPAILCAY
jgi:hypothetical protein